MSRTWCTSAERLRSCLLYATLTLSLSMKVRLHPKLHLEGFAFHTVTHTYSQFRATEILTQFPTSSAVSCGDKKYGPQSWSMGKMPSPFSQTNQEVSHLKGFVKCELLYPLNRKLMANQSFAHCNVTSTYSLRLNGPLIKGVIKMVYFQEFSTLL